MLYKYTVFTIILVTIAIIGFVCELVALPLRSTNDLIIYMTQLCLFGVLVISAFKAYEAERAYDLRLRTEAELQHLTKLDEVFPHE